MRVFRMLPVVGLALLTVACAHTDTSDLPKPVQFQESYNLKTSAYRHWHLLAGEEADRLAKILAMDPSLRDAPVKVLAPDRASVFEVEFANFLESMLSKRGFGVAMAGEGTPILISSSVVPHANVMGADSEQKIEVSYTISVAKADVLVSKRSDILYFGAKDKALFDQPMVKETPVIVLKSIQLEQPESADGKPATKKKLKKQVKE